MCGAACCDVISIPENEDSCMDAFKVTAILYVTG